MGLAEIPLDILSDSAFGDPRLLNKIHVYDLSSRSEFPVA